MTRTLFLAALVLLALPACDSTATPPPDLSTQTAADVAADPPSGRDPNTGQALDTGKYALFSLRTGQVVVGYDAADRSDSTSTLWDIGFNGTDVILNGGSSGPGAAVGVVVEEAFGDVADAIADAPAFRRDGESPCPSGPARAVCGGSGNGWYTYTPFPSGFGGYILPTPGRTLVVRLADGQGYAKVQFVSYYRGNPAPAAIDAQSEGRYYTFNYVTNPSGTALEASAQ